MDCRTRNTSLRDLFNAVRAEHPDAKKNKTTGVFQCPARCVAEWVKKAGLGDFSVDVFKRLGRDGDANSKIAAAALAFCGNFGTARQQRHVKLEAARWSAHEREMAMEDAEDDVQQLHDDASYEQDKWENDNEPDEPRRRRRQIICPELDEQALLDAESAHTASCRAYDDAQRAVRPAEEVIDGGEQHFTA